MLVYPIKNENSKYHEYQLTVGQIEKKVFSNLPISTLVNKRYSEGLPVSAPEAMAFMVASSLVSKINGVIKIKMKNSKKQMVKINKKGLLEYILRTLLKMFSYFESVFVKNIISKLNCFLQQPFRVLKCIVY
jgi:hypothetical protein